jgi:cyclohexyl-isocyanide hydratase
MSSSAPSLGVAMVVFPGFTQLDLTGAFEVLARVPGARVSIVAARREPVRSDTGLSLGVDAAFGEIESCEVLFVPGGPGINGALRDESLLAFVRDRGARAKWVTSVCTGALVLGAAGLLRGHRATTHWLSVDLLPIFGATHVDARVVVDGNRVTGGGVTAGIDFALRLAALVAGDDVARSIQLLLEYDPAPPFDAGSPRRAPGAMVEAMKAERAAVQSERRALLEAIVTRT